MKDYVKSCLSENKLGHAISLETDELASENNTDRIVKFI